MKWLVRLFLIEIWNIVRDYVSEYQKLKVDREENQERVNAYKNAKSLNEALSAFDNLP